ncbi:MAG: hypothetical protein UH241_02535, partial [Acutalibacteraceae bacterium]|nr:hypothetical protein [Acutalibacteraceae bacterium]
VFSIDKQNYIISLRCIMAIKTMISKRDKYKVYGEGGKELSGELHTYEIGSITKTITAGTGRRIMYICQQEQLHLIFQIC